MIHVGIYTCTIWVHNHHDIIFSAVGRCLHGQTSQCTPSLKESFVIRTPVWLIRKAIRVESPAGIPFCEVSPGSASLAVSETVSRGTSRDRRYCEIHQHRAASWIWLGFSSPYHLTLSGLTVAKACIHTLLPQNVPGGLFFTIVI